MVLLFSPLEQFEIFPLFFFRVSNFDFSITNNFFISFIIFFLMVSFYMSISAGRGLLVPSRWQSLAENFYRFTIGLVVENITKKGQIYFPFFYSLFFFLLFCNLVGLVPYSFTLTSHLIFTFGLSLIVWVGKLFIGFKSHGIKIFSILLPGGVPLAIYTFFIVVELISFYIPLAALAIRLFANMIAGHILLKVIVGFCWTILCSGGLLSVAHFIPIVILFLLLFLETAVAFIQAYVFTILACLITGDIIKGGHLFYS